MPFAIPPNAQAVVVEADSPSVTIWPSDAWTFSSNETLYTGGSYRLTKVRGARAEFSFTGSEVWFYADKNIDHGTYTIQIDDGPVQTQSSYSPNLVMQIALYTTKVTPGNHRLTLTNMDPMCLGVDYFAYMPLSPESVSGAISSHSTFPSSTPGESAASATTQALNRTWAVLSLCFVALALFFVLSLFVCHAHWRRRRVALV